MSGQSTIEVHRKGGALAIRLDRVSKTYFRARKPVTAIDDVSLEVSPGEIVAVIGARGSGKTTLLKLAAGLERPDSGRVWFGDTSLERLGERQLTEFRRTQLGCVMSMPVAFGRSDVRELVALPLRLQSGDGRSALVEAERTLAALAIEQCADATLEELSDGERRLVAVAQALVTKPRYLLLDRPSEDLRLSEEKHLLEALRSITAHAGVAVLMTARSGTEAVAADRLFSLSRGRLIGAERASAPTTGEADILDLNRHRHRQQGGGSDA